uniref:hypothetical protein n=1 Tax=Eubacterium sp. TaxID=142586 RepID=UPI0040260B78
WYPVILDFFFHLTVNALFCAFIDVIVVVGIDSAKTVIGNVIDINNIIVVITINIRRFIIFLLYDLFNNV